MSAKLHLFVCFVTLVIQGGAMAKCWPLHHYNQCMYQCRWISSLHELISLSVDEISDCILPILPLIRSISLLI